MVAVPIHVTHTAEQSFACHSRMAAPSGLAGSLLRTLQVWQDVVFLVQSSANSASSTRIVLMRIYEYHVARSVDMLKPLARCDNLVTG